MSDAIVGGMSIAVDGDVTAAISVTVDVGGDETVWLSGIGRSFAVKMNNNNVIKVFGKIVHAVAYTPRSLTPIRKQIMPIFRQHVS